METARVPSARSLLVAALAVCLVMSGCASGKSVSATVAKSNGNHIAAGLLGGPFTSASVGSAESILARSGIATVANESSTTPLVGVTGSVRMTFTRAQVTSLALGAADGNGTTGSALDATAKMPSGDPSFSYLLAAWVSPGQHAGSHGDAHRHGPAGLGGCTVNYLPHHRAATLCKRRDHCERRVTLISHTGVAR
jgi:hypothetical protein